MKSQHNVRDRALVERPAFETLHLVRRRSTALIAACSGARMLSRSALMSIEQCPAAERRQRISAVATAEVQ